MKYKSIKKTFLQKKYILNLDLEKSFTFLLAREESCFRSLMR